VDKNYTVLKRIAEILNKYKSYKVTVEGHANSIGKIYAYSADKIQKEESSEVLPLSQSRAEAVRAFLVKYGVDEKRLSAKGLGSAEAVVDPKDADNRWKNRRVEFILEK
jgi:outer membrane protein OmpA-like peptidoglycan-associated protein